MWAIALGGILITFLIAGLINIAAASPDEQTSGSNFPIPALQVTITPTATTQIVETTTPNPEPASASEFSFTLAELGYDEVTLSSPHGTTRYSFRLPENWTIRSDGLLVLDLSYAYNQINTGEYPALFGDLTIKLDDQTLEIFSIDEEFDNQQLTVSLPLALLADPDRSMHFIELIFDAAFLCDVPHKAKLVLYPTSSVSLNYDRKPLKIDLAHYPRPFFQSAFDPDNVRFVLPSELTSNDFDNALAIAAKLGDLTTNQLAISATTDLDLGRLLSTNVNSLDEHLIIVGQPEANQFLPFLNEITSLPVSLHQRQLKLETQGPTAVAPGDTVTYAFSIANTFKQEIELSVVNSLSNSVALLGCDPDCVEEKSEQSIVWNELAIAPNETANLFLTLQTTDALTGTFLEQTVTLIETDSGPLNADTLRATIVADSSNHSLQTSVPREEEYFFVYEGKAVSDGDGVVQEIVSPWNEERAILIITGTNDESVQKASQAMSSEARFPGMSGAVTLVEDVRPLSELGIGDLESSDGEMTFAEMGYSDQIVLGGGGTRQVNYFFELPYGWQLTDDAFMEIHFSHSRLIDYARSGMNVLINNKPVASVAFSDETSDDGRVRIGLSRAGLQTGNNRLTFELDVSMPGVCVDSDQAWIRLRDSSKVSLAHHQDGGSDLNLKFFPNPFRTNPALNEILFVLSNPPTVEEFEAALRIAERLGSSADYDSFSPKGIFGEDYLSKNLENIHLVAIGLPSRSALIQQVNDQLPQPYLPGSDQIQQILDNIVFRLPMEVDLGQVQLIPSPWDETRALLAISGTTETGIDKAMHVLLKRPWLLKGNLAFVTGDEVEAIDTRKLIGEGVAKAVVSAVPEMTPAATATQTEVVTAVTVPLVSGTTPGEAGLPRIQNEASYPAWLIPLVGMTTLIVIVIFAFAFWQTRQRNHGKNSL